MYVSSSTAHYKSHLYNHWYLLFYVQDHSRNSMEHVNTNTLVNIPHCSVGNWSIGIPIVKGSILNVLAFRLINLKLIKYLCLTNRCFLSRITQFGTAINLHAMTLASWDTNECFWISKGVNFLDTNSTKKRYPVFQLIVINNVVLYLPTIVNFVHIVYKKHHGFSNSHISDKQYALSSPLTKINSTYSCKFQSKPIQKKW